MLLGVRYPCLWLAAVSGIAGCGSVLPPEDSGAVGKTISTAGGFITSEDGVLTIVFPPDSLPEVTLVAIQRAVDLPASIGPAYRVTPVLDLDAPAVVAYRYALPSIEGRDPEVLTVGHLAGEQWTFLEGGALDAETQQVSGEDPRLSFAYGLLENTAIDPDDDTTGTTASGGESTLGASSTANDTTGSDTGSEGGTEPACGDGKAQPGELCLAPAFPLIVPTGPTALAAADLDGDGAIDLIVAGGGSADVSVLLGAGDGTFGAPEPFATGLGPAALVTHDITGDGAIDIIVAEAGTDTVSVLPGDGQGAVGAPVPFAVGDAPSSLLLGDFNSDDILDVVSGDSGTGRVSLLLGSGTTLLQAQDFALAAGLSGIASGNFNADNYLDLVGVSATGASLILGNGNALFGGPFALPVAGASSAIAVLDADEDDLLDFALTQSDLNTVTLLAGGLAAGGVPFATGLSPAAVQAADLNGDQRADLAVVGAGDDSLTILLGAGTGNFDPSASFTVGVGPNALVIADFNGDGVPDIAVSADDDSITILLSDT